MCAGANDLPPASAILESSMGDFMLGKVISLSKPYLGQLVQGQRIQPTSHYECGKSSYRSPPVPPCANMRVR